MNHDQARKIFLEIQARPFSLSLNAGEVSNNCYFKGVELLQRLGVLGYTVRGRVGETYWDKNIIPADIVDLLPSDILVTHFFVEVFIDDEWRIVDPTFQPSLSKYGFQIGSWKGTEHPCFPITKLYTQEENIVYQGQWFNSAYQQDFFEKGGACWEALDGWFGEIAQKV